MRRSLVTVWIAISAFAVHQANADPVTDELARRTHLTQAELTEFLNNCNKTQMSMNFCALKDFVKADMELTVVLNQKSEGPLKSCQEKLKRKQAKWIKTMDRSCNKEADEEAEGGSMRPMVLASCQAQRTEIRTEELKKISACSKIR